MPNLSPEQLQTRRRVESLIRLMAPGLNLVLSVGERISRIVEPEDYEYYPPRSSQVEPASPGSAKPPGPTE